MVVWWGTTVEARSAFARLVREGELTLGQRVTAIRLLHQLRDFWDEILPSQIVRSTAEGLPDEYGVRAADALQLAAALVWCRERPRRRPFVCFDERLAKAASALGFSVRP
jgi:predicted nucleic acid-binding protein